MGTQKMILILSHHPNFYTRFVLSPKFGRRSDASPDGHFSAFFFLPYIINMRVMVGVKRVVGE